LPTGFGITTDLSRQSRRLKSSVDFNGVLLTQQLRPTGALSFAGSILAAEESKPLWFQCSGLTWQVAAGKFEMTGASAASYVRQAEVQRLENAQQLKDDSMKVKRSNEGLFRYVGGVQGGTPFVVAGANGEALLTASLVINSGHMKTHFPYDASFDWSGG